MLKVSSKTIGAHEYNVRQLVATRGRLVALRLGRILGPAVAEFAGDNPKDRIGKALEKAFGALSDEDFSFLCNTFADSTDVVIHDEKGTRTPKLSTCFDLHFAGRYDEMFEWLYFCIEVNFGSFFDRLGLLRGTAAPAP